MKAKKQITSTVIKPVKFHPQSPTPDPDALIFTSGTGMPVTGASRGSWWTRARREVGVPQLVWHGLRHTAQTIAAESGTDVATLMQRMGHSTIQATMVYLRSTPNGQQRLAQNLDKQTGLPTVIDLADYRSRDVG